MKKLIFILFIPGFCFGQKNTSDEIDSTFAVDLQMFYPDSIGSQKFFADSPGSRKSFSDSLSKLFNLATFHCMKGDSLLGIKLSTKFISIVPTYAMGYNIRGCANQRCYKYPEALNDFRKSISLNKKDYKPVFNTGLAYYELRNFQTAIKYFDSALVLNPKHVRSYYFKANSASKLGDNETAIKCFNKSIELDPKHYKSYKDRANTYYLLKNFKLAIIDFDNAISINSLDYEVYAFKAMSLLKMEQITAAILELDKAQKLTTNPLVDYLYGVAYMAKADKTLACKYFKKARDKKFSGAEKFVTEYCK